MYCSLEYVMFTSCNDDVLYVVYYYIVMLVGALKAVQCTTIASSASQPNGQDLVLQLVGLGLGNVFFPSFFFSLLKVTNIFVLCVSGNCDVCGIRTTTVCDVMMMYSQERYMENVPKRFSANLYAPCLENSTPFPPSRDLLLSFNNIQ